MYLTFVQNLYYAKLMADNKDGGGARERGGGGNGGTVHDIVLIANIIDTLLINL